MVSSVFAVLSALTTVALAVPARRAGAPLFGNLVPSQHTNLCVVAAGNANANGTPVQLAPCTSAANAIWTSTFASLRIFENQCLDVVNGVNADGTRLQTWECTDGPNQQFDIEGSTIRWTTGNKCIDVTNGVFSPGTPLQMWDCTSGPNQVFTFPVRPPSSTTTPPSTPTSPPTKFTLFKPTAHPQFCMDVAGGVDADNTALQIFSCNGSPAQNFYPSSGGFHIFENKAIDLTNGDQTNGNKLQIFTSFTGNTNQQWTYDSTNKAFRLTSNPNKCIDITDGVFADSTRLQIWDCTFGPNQQFSPVALAD